MIRENVVVKTQQYFLSVKWKKKLFWVHFRILKARDWRLLLNANYNDKAREKREKKKERKWNKENKKKINTTQARNRTRPNTNFKITDFFEP